MKKILIELPADLVAEIRQVNKLDLKEYTNKDYCDNVSAKLMRLFGETEGPLTDIFVPLFDERRQRIKR